MKFLLALSFFMSLNAFSNEMINQLIERREQIKEWQLLCKGKYEGQASINVGCDQWDMVKFSGHSCLAAQLAGDTETVQARCRDVELGQDENGRWWRGQKNIGSTRNSFSRDMMYGVIDYFISQGILHPSEARRDEVRARAQNWINWIEREGKGKQMCGDNVGLFSNSCQTRRSRILYHTLLNMGAINSSNEHYKFVRRSKKRKGLNGMEIETFLTPPGYPLFLKSNGLYQRYLMNVINKKQYQKVAKIIYDKNPENPWFEFFYVGPTRRNIQKTLERCPITRPTKADWTVNHFATGDFQWQRATRDRAWEKTSGHDCITLLNYQIAALSGTMDLPSKESGGECLGEELGEIDGKKICKVLLANDISKVKCDQKNGFVWDKEYRSYCLWDNGNHFKARDLKRTCPSGNKLIGNHEGYPLCEKKKLKKIKLYRCNKIGTGEYVGTESYLLKNDEGKPTHCYVYRDTWYQKRKLGKWCPVGTKSTGELLGSWAPVCKSPLRISRKRCEKPKKYNIARKDYCLVRKNGWFAKRKYTK